MIEICNIKKIKIEKPWDIRVDRKNLSLGNPYFMRDESQRNKVCEQYEKWMLSQIDLKTKHICGELNRIFSIHKKYGKLRLFCWCAPKRCHSETIKKIIESKL